MGNKNIPNHWVRLQNIHSFQAKLLQNFTNFANFVSYVAMFNFRDMPRLMRMTYFEPRASQIEITVANSAVMDKSLMDINTFLHKSFCK